MGYAVTLNESAHSIVQFRGVRVRLLTAASETGRVSWFWPRDASISARVLSPPLLECKCTVKELAVSKRVSTACSRQRHAFVCGGYGLF